MAETYSRRALRNLVRTIEDAKTEKTVDQLFLSDLNASIEKTEFKGQRDPSKTYKPSGMSCMRQCFYTQIGVPIQKEVKASAGVGISESGTDRHDRIQKALAAMRENGFDLEYIDVETYINDHNLSEKIQVIDKIGMETKLYIPELNLSFMTDGIIKYRGIYYIFEFKTEVPTKFDKRITVDEAHHSQAAAYSCAFELPDVMFLYENRAFCTKKAYLFHVTDEMRQEKIYDFIRDCNEFIQNKIVPPMPTDPVTLKKCKYCQYKALCAKHGVSSKLFLGV